MATTNLADLKQGKTAHQAASVSSFNPDAWHAMQERDDQLIRDSVLHGYAGKEYVYQFNIGDTNVTGVSVVGARELASHYGGIKHRIVASVDKTGSLFVFKSLEPLAVQASIIPQLADEEDFYEVVIEITDIKTGNSIQVRKKETKVEKRRNGSTRERPHFDVIAESKAYRNGVLSIIPQNVIKEFEARALRAGNSGNEKTIDQLREGAVAFCAKHGIAVNRQAVSSLTYAEMQGLSSAAAGGADSFKEAAEALGILQTKMSSSDSQDGGQRQIEQQQSRTIPQQTRAPATVQHDAETGEIHDPAAGQHQGDAAAPSFADAHAAVRSGDLDLARDIARSLPDQQRQQIDAAITNLSSEQPQDASARGRGRHRAQGGLGLE